MSRSARAAAWISLGIALASCSHASPARADPIDECVGSAEDSQRLRLEGKLLRARELLAACSRPECPAVVRKDCARWSSEVDALVPSVVAHALDAKGNPVRDVAALVDGKPMPGWQDGLEVSLDPGAHVLRFTRADGSFEQNVVLQPGEKRRALSIVLTPPVSPMDDAPRPAPPPRRPFSRDPLMPWSIATLGAGGVALGVASYFWISGLVNRGRLESTCGPGHSCTPSAVDSAHGDLVVGDVAGVAGASLGAIGMGLLLFARTPRQPSLSATLAPTPRGIMLGVGGDF
jgi:hypothetical protein